MRFEVNPDISKATAPPGWLYHDESTYNKIIQCAFKNSWQWAAHQKALPEAGRVYPLTILPGSLNNHLLLTRDDNNNINAFSNVCSHRGNIVCNKAGSAKKLVCKYHSRTFDLNGKALKAPGFENDYNFPSEEDHLKQWEIDSLGPFIFVANQPKQSLSDMFSHVQERVGWLPLNEFIFEPSRTKRYELDANWILYIENYLEGLHVNSVHGSSIAPTQDLHKYETHLIENGALQIGIANDDAAHFELPEGHPDYGKKIAAYYYWFYPNLMMNFYPWGLSINVVKPQSAQKTFVDFITYVWKPALLTPSDSYDLHQVEMEDELIVKQVQQGTADSNYRGGKYSTQWESAVHSFHQLLSNSIND